MVGKIGKLTQIAAIVCMWSVLECAGPSLSLRVTDARGKSLEQAQTDVPFSIIITIVGDFQNLPTPFIEGLDAFELKGTSHGTRTMSVNGQTTVTKTMQISAVASDEGTYTLGPAKITFQGKTFSSESLSLIVGKKQEFAPSSSKEQALMVTSFDKPSIYQGEPVVFSLRFYYADDAIRLDAIKEPQFKDFSAAKLEGPASGTSTLHDKKYRYLEWNTTAYPEKSGTLKVGSVEGVYTEPTQVGMFGGMASFFGGMREQHSVNSNSVSVEVKPLPAYHVSVKAVGSFSRIVLRLNNDKAHEGEAVVAFFDIYGSGNITQISHPALVLPDDLSVYESNTEIARADFEYKKSFEYVVQGKAAGTYVISSQEFIYFDPREERYKILKTDPVQLVIAESTVTKKAADNQTANAQEARSIPAVFEIIHDGAWQKVRFKIIPWWLFFMFMAFMIFAIGGCYGYKKYALYQQAHAPLVRYKQAFKVARKNFENARKHGYVGYTYHVFVELFAARLYKERTEISEEFMEDFLCQKGLSEADMVKWRLLLAHLAQYAFAYHGFEDEHKNKIFNQAAYWLNRLEALL